MATAITYHKTVYGIGEKRITLPIFFLLVYIVCTFFPQIYIFFPFLGTISAVLIAGWGLLLSYVITRDKYHNPKAYENPVFKTWIGFLTVLIFGIIFSVDRGRSQGVAIVCLKFFLIFLITIKIIDSPKRLDMLFGFFATCGVGMAISCLYNYIIGESWFGGIKFFAIAVGIFADPNDLGILLNSTLPFVLYFYLKGRRKLISLISLIGMGIIITAIVVTFSRGSFVGLCMVGFGFYRIIGKKTKKYLVLLLLGILLVPFFAPGGHMERMKTIYTWEVDEETGKTGTRLDIWIPNLIMCMKNPIFGVGAGNSMYVNAKTANDWHDTHNAPLQVLTDIGFIGLYFYILLFIIPFRYYKQITRQHIKLSNEDLLRMRVILLSFIGFGATAFFLPHAYSPILFLLTGFYVAQLELIAKSTVISNLSP